MESIECFLLGHNYTEWISVGNSVAKRTCMRCKVEQRELMSCDNGWHDFSTWGSPFMSRVSYDGLTAFIYRGPIQERVCKKCGKVDARYLQV